MKRTLTPMRFYFFHTEAGHEEIIKKDCGPQLESSLPSYLCELRMIDYNNLTTIIKVIGLRKKVSDPKKLAIFKEVKQA